MELEKQVCSLELANKLKELGVEKESLYIYDTDLLKYPVVLSSTKQRPIRFASAFTVAELGELLPRAITTSKTNNGWQVYFHNSKRFNEDFKLEANARAAMLIYLIEQKLLQPHH